MAPKSRTRAVVGRPQRRTRASARAQDSKSGVATLAPIGEDVELPKALSATSTGTHISDSPDRKQKLVRARDDTASFEDAKERKKRRAIELLAKIEAEVEERCEALMAEAEHKARDLQLELNVQLMYLPESVRRMRWKTFIEDFDGSLENVIQDVKDRDYRNYIAASPLKSARRPVQPLPPPATPAATTTTATATVQRPARRLPPLPQATPAQLHQRRQMAFETPSFTPFAHKVPGTIARTARKGEIIYACSFNGSPIVPDTFTQAPAAAAVGATGAAIDNAAVIDLSHPESLDTESSAQTKATIQALQAKIAELTRRLPKQQ